MKADATRLVLVIDVFEKKEQQARAQPDLLPIQLIAAILEEFRELDYLSNTPEDYRLLKAADEVPLDGTQPLHEQVRSEAHLLLAEAEVDLPPGAHAPPSPIYLR